MLERQQITIHPGLCDHLADFHLQISVFVGCTQTHFWIFHSLLQENRQIFWRMPTHQNLRGNTDPRCIYIQQLLMIDKNLLRQNRY